ncbi:MAG: zinc ribbon domain-containing protein [Chloroflexi bacterium]|nr:zinc ribbon domain-containing protein [Chloroflexota bacterium]
MPIYEYECTCCPTRFELKQSFDEDSQVTCPKCGGDAMRVFSPVPVIFKGSGFYVTDYRGKNSSSETDKSDSKKSS